MTYYRSADLPVHPLAPGVNARMMHGEGMTVMRAYLESGARVPSHRHPHEQVSTVLSGRLRLVVEGKEHVLEPGSTLFIPGNAEHNALAEADTEVLDVFTPVRDDYRRLG